MDVLDEIAEKHNASVTQVSLNYLFNKPGISSVVVGSKKMKHLEENIKSTEIELDKEDIAKINKISEPAYPYPHWFKKSIWEKDGIRV